MHVLDAKLKLKDLSIQVINAPPAWSNFMNTDENAAAILYFCKDEQDIIQAAKWLQFKNFSYIWLAYPKKSSGIKTNINRDKGWESIQKLGLIGVMQVSLDDTWSALRFKPESSIKTLKRGTTADGIDTIKKTVQLPADLQAALTLSGHLEIFEKMAFSHCKEYVTAILEAKKPETREKRIQLTITAMAEKAKSLAGNSDR